MQLRVSTNEGIKESNFNEYDNYDELKISADRDKVKSYFESIEV